MNSTSSQRTIWFNGELMAESEAHLSPFDRGFTAGDGCSEAIVTYEGLPFAFSRHYERLRQSASKLNFDLKSLPSKEKMFQAVRSLIATSTYSDPMLIRIVVSSGVAQLGKSRSDTPCTVLMWIEPAFEGEETVSLVELPYVVNEKSPLAGVVTSSSRERQMMLEEARSKGAGECLLANTQGKLCSGAESNVFWVEDGTVCTPSLEDGALPGVTRDLVIELCSQLKIPVCEKSLPMSSLKSLSEVFITSTLREVQPVAMIGERRLFPGAVTIMLRKAYKDLLDDIDP